MSIVRLSFVGGVLRETDGVGDLTEGGELEKFDGPAVEFGKTPQLDKYLEREIAKKAIKLTAEQPVMLMVHGFWYDPSRKVDADKPENTDNPHGLNYHFLKNPSNANWRHTASWPRGFGIRKIGDKEDEEAIGGQNGLAVALGWDSTPALLKRGETSQKAWEDAGKSLLKKLKESKLAELVKDLSALAEGLEAMRNNSAAKELAVVAKEVRTHLEKLRNSTSIWEKAKEGKAVIRTGETLLELLGKAIQSAGEEAIPVFDILAKYSPEVYAEAYRRAEKAAEAFANTIHAVTRILPGRPIDLFCHSLGSRVVIRALFQIAKKKPSLLNPQSGVNRVIIVGGAEYQEEAKKMLSAVQNATHGDCPTFYNFMGRRDRVLAYLAGKYHPILPDLTKPIGCYGLGALGMSKEPHWIDLQLDKDNEDNHRLNSWLIKQKIDGFSGSEKMPIGSTAPLGILNHWYYFTNPVNMELFRMIIRNRSDWDLDALRRKNIPENEVGIIE
jgi:pimeloyl-ACP methyl ester carboxylesterase